MKKTAPATKLDMGYIMDVYNGGLVNLEEMAMSHKPNNGFGSNSGFEPYAILIAKDSCP